MWPHLGITWQSEVQNLTQVKQLAIKAFCITSNLTRYVLF